MSHHSHSNHESPFSPSSTGGGSHNGLWYPEQGRAILPRLIVAFRASDSPVIAQDSIVPYGLPTYPPTQQQETHAPYHLTFPPLEQPSEARYHSGQTHGGFHNSAFPSSSSPELLWHVPSEVLGGGSLQGLLYNPSHAEQIPPTLSDLRPQHSVYSPALSFLQSHSATSPTYPAGDSSYRGATPTVVAANTHQQSMEVNIASLDYTIPGSRGTSCAHVSTASSHVPYDVSPEATKSTIRKKRKRTDARQLDELNKVYSRTPYPSTEERQRLARDLDMCPRRVQVWFQNKRQLERRNGRNPSNSPISQVTHPPETPPVVVHSRGSPTPVGSMDDHLILLSLRYWTLAVTGLRLGPVGDIKPFGSQFLGANIP
ncbi:hypothetical protein BJV77DRAFT_1066471 [Russula vinacea]|nr:hypothetical protein BJV77DRAFT_1066471 [Russula vinacea]